MPKNSLYYDTCIFLHGLNPQDRSHRHCSRLLDLPSISWRLAICRELSAAEAAIGEYLDRFEISCISAGVAIEVVALSGARVHARKYKGLKRELSRIGFGGNDWWHVMACAAIGIEALCSADEDYFDPANKRNPKAKKKSSAVRDEIERTLRIDILRPEEACGLYLDAKGPATPIQVTQTSG